MLEENKNYFQLLDFTIKKKNRNKARQYEGYSKYKDRQTNQENLSRSVSSQIGKRQASYTQIKQRNSQNIHAKLQTSASNYSPLVTIKLIPQQYRQSRSVYLNPNKVKLGGTVQSNKCFQNLSIFLNEKIRTMLSKKQYINRKKQQEIKNKELNFDQKYKISARKSLATKLKKKARTNKVQSLISNQNSFTKPSFR